MSEHTKEPWRVDDKGIRAIIRGDDLTIIAVRHRNSAEQNEIDFKRIVACVNACTGIYTEWLENYPRLHASLLGDLQNVSYQLDLAETSRDELAVAIKAALCDDPDWRRLCVDALAKAEGRTA